MDAWAAGLAAHRGRPSKEGNDLTAREATGGQDALVEWVRVATAMGTPNAVIIAGRLGTHQIPTRVTQEAAGARAFAVTVGILGTAHVWVPEEYVALAESVLATEWDDEEE